MVHYYSIFIVVVLVLLTIFAYRWLNDDTTPEMDVDVAVERSGDAPKNCSGLCPKNLAPVCGYDTSSGTSMSYSNDCVFSAAQCRNSNLQFLNKGKCPDSKDDVSKAGSAGVVQPKKCGKACYSNIAPVCGYDSETGTSKEYVNECAFSIAQCKNPNLKLLNKGKCPASKDAVVGAAVGVVPPKKCSGICPMLFVPVCGYDSSSKTSKTYSNECTFSNAQCENPNLKLLNKGKCPKEGAVGKVGAAVVRPKDKCYKGCPKLHAPVCGYDSENGTSKSYSNGCEFSNAQCENPNLKKLNTGLCPGESIVYV